MKKDMLYKEIGLIDDDLILEAERKQEVGQVNLIWKKFRLGACFLSLVLLIGIIPSLSAKKGIPPLVDPNKKPSTIISDSDGNTLIFNRAQGRNGHKIYIPGHFWEELTDKEIELILPGISLTGEREAIANFQGDGSLFNIDIYSKIKTGQNLYIQVAPGQTILDYSFGIEAKESLINGRSLLAGYNESVHFANFKLDDIGYYIEIQTDEKDMVLSEKTKEVFVELIYNIISGGAADLSILNPTIPEGHRDDRLSLREAYEDGAFGAYIPREVPKGFKLESSNRFINQENDLLSVLWTKGLNNLSWKVSRFTEGDKNRLTSISEKENYNLELYPIPRAGSVPEELWQIVDNPIFKIDELSLEVVRARAYTADDKGDEAGYRMEFSVLYEDGILVELNAKGLDPEYIFKQLIEMGQEP